MDAARGDSSAPEERRLGPVLVGVDGSESARVALGWAAAEAEAHGLSVRAVSTYMVPAMAAAAPSFTFQPANIQELADYCQKVLATEIAEVSRRHPSVRIEAQVIEGPAAQVLIDSSASASLLVVGSRGHGGVVGLLLGSVSQHCVTHASCPVLVVRPYSGQREGAGKPGGSRDD